MIGKRDSRRSSREHQTFSDVVADRRAEAGDECKGYLEPHWVDPRFLKGFQKSSSAPISRTFCAASFAESTFLEEARARQGGGGCGHRSRGAAGEARPRPRRREGARAGQGPWRPEEAEEGSGTRRTASIPEAGASAAATDSHRGARAGARPGGSQAPSRVSPLRTRTLG